MFAQKIVLSVRQRYIGGRRKNTSGGENRQSMKNFPPLFRRSNFARVDIAESRVAVVDTENIGS